MIAAFRAWAVGAGRRRVLWPFALLLAMLLFAGGPGYRSPRSVQAFWNLGHVAAFSLWTYLLITWKRMEEATHARRWGTGIAFCIVAGAGSEWLQSLTGRDASLVDVLRDVAGGVLALSWAVPSAKTVSREARRAARCLSAFIILAACLPLAAAIGDEAIARIRFPVLSDFETPFETSRWEGDAGISVDSSSARHGKASLRVDLNTSLYSGVSLVHFPGNWRGYRFLVLEALNPSAEVLEITARIHDRRHEAGERKYSDRFNKVFRLQEGWNEIRIGLDEVSSAPAGRTMDLGEVRDVGFFAARLPRPRTIYLDHVRLE